MNVDFVIIGLNTGKTLEKCLKSVFEIEYDKKLIHVFYVDGGSKDNSVAIAKTFKNVEVIVLNPLRPTPGLGRNNGWKAGNSPLVQFLDSDTLIDPSFLSKALPHFSDPKIGAVKGYRKELHPDKSVYNWIADQEWNDLPGKSQAFGGDVLIRRSILEATGGYNETLVAGEDPELSLRVRKTGYDILCIDALMCYHDIAMLNFLQYWKRAYRTGFGYASVYELHRNSSDFWEKERKRILLRGGGTVFLFIFGLLSYCLAWIPALILLFYPRIFKVKELSQQKHLPLDKARLYAWHCSFVVIPQFFGILRYYIRKLFPSQGHPAMEPAPNNNHPSSSTKKL